MWLKLTTKYALFNYEIVIKKVIKILYNRPQQQAYNTD
jgi:hypothetical protein